jgi:hypothetical protein
MTNPTSAGPDPINPDGNANPQQPNPYATPGQTPFQQTNPYAQAPQNPYGANLYAQPTQPTQPAQPAQPTPVDPNATQSFQQFDQTPYGTPQQSSPYATGPVDPTMGNANMYGAPTVLPAKKKNKGLAIGLGIGIPVVVVIVVICIIVAVVSANAIKSIDYSNAYKQTTNVSLDYSDVGLEMTNLFTDMTKSTATGTASDTQRLTSKLTAFDSSVKKLSQMKALGDQDVKKSYDTFAKKKTSFDKFTKDLVTTYPMLYKFNKACDSSGLYSSESDVQKEMTNLSKWVDSCEAAGNDLQQAPIASFAKVGQSTVTALDKLKPIIKDIQGLGSMDKMFDDGTFDKYLDDENQLTDAESDLSEVTLSLSDDLSNEIEAVDVSDSLDDLQSILLKKEL